MLCKAEITQLYMLNKFYKFKYHINNSYASEDLQVLQLYFLFLYSYIFR